jgi:hypothetical protein
VIPLLRHQHMCMLLAFDCIAIDWHLRLRDCSCYDGILTDGAGLARKTYKNVTSPMAKLRMYNRCPKIEEDTKQRTHVANQIDVENHNERLDALV